jgi:hypothetical protein
MTKDGPKKKPPTKGPPDPQTLIWHIEAAVQEVDVLDPMAGFLLRVTMESLRKAMQQREAEAQDSAA